MGLGDAEVRGWGWGVGRLGPQLWSPKVMVPVANPFAPVRAPPGHLYSQGPRPRVGGVGGEESLEDLMAEGG